MDRIEISRLGGRAYGIIATKHRNKRIETYNENSKLCRYCSKPLEYSKRHNTFCNKSCATSFNNSHSAKRSLDKAYCVVCGAVITNRTKCCSRQCAVKYRRNKVVDSWKASGQYGSSKSDSSFLSHYIKTYLREKYNNRCAKCGWHEINSTTGKVPLTVDHIDGNSENHIESNLILLCPNCHSLTPTYGGANRGNGRKRRRESYVSAAKK